VYSYDALARVWVILAPPLLASKCGASGVPEMKDRPLSFAERREQLVGSLDTITNALNDYETRGKIYPLRIVAVELRKLIYYKDTRSFRHPLLIDLTRERNFPLIVYRTDPAYAAKVKQMRPIFYTAADHIAVDQHELSQSGTTVDVVLKEIHATVLDQEYSLEDIILAIANMEAAHSDPKRLLILDDFDRVDLGGLPTHYRAVYHMGRVVRDLTSRFLQATV
jgi:hypothetical protein